MKKYLPLFGLLLAVIIGSGILVATMTRKAAESEVIRQETGKDTGQNNLQVSGGNNPTISGSSGLSGKNEITLNISSPNNGAVVSSASVTVRGQTSPKAEVFVNETEAAADGSGNFTVGYKLEEGDNYIVVVVTDPEGNTAEKELTVTYEPVE